MNRYIAAVAICLTTASRAAAQDPVVTPPPEIAAESLPPSNYPWLLGYFPYVAGGMGGGPVAAVRVRYFQPAPYAERQTYRAEAVAELGIGLHGSRFAELRYRAPLLSEELRVNARLLTRRNTRDTYFGLGNDTELDPAVEDAQEFAYRVHRTRYVGSLEVSRRIVGRLKIAGLGQVANDRFYQLSEASVFASDFGAELTETDVSGRAALVLDLRDNEFDPTAGVLLDAGFQVGSGGDGYTRIYGLGRFYRRLGSRMMVTARLGVSQLDGDPPLAAHYEIPAWESTLRVYGGSTNRALRSSRFGGEGVLFGSLDVRRELLLTRNALSVTAVAFVDAGRVFQDENVRLTTEDLAVAGGLGLAVRILRSTTVIGYVATGPDGVKLNIGAGWAY